MNLAKFTCALLGTSLSMSIAFISLPVAGVQTKDGTVAFEAGLLLADTYATFTGVRARSARYYFDLELPADIGEPLQKVVIQQRAGGDDVKFKPEKTKVYLGDHRHKDEEIQAISSTDESTATITVEFARPIPPGSKITVGIKPKRNPDYAGVYLFGVTAFPQGNKARGMYLGSGRLHFYRGSDGHFW
ncbi:MAG: DUF2808 domain-containing protein [Cyanobacteria bacterium J06623_7]